MPASSMGVNTLGEFQSDKVADVFHDLFDPISYGIEESFRKKGQKKTKNCKKNKDKANKQKGEKNINGSLEKQVPNIELLGNPSAFCVFSSIRQAVLEHQTKQASEIFARANQKSLPESEDEEEDEKKENPVKLPKIVGVGLCGVFELINETKSTHAPLCRRALQALLNMLQGQTPEGLKHEPVEVMESLYFLLMELSTSKPKGIKENNTDDAESLTALACSCLMSLVIARGDTGNILSAIAAMLMSPTTLTTQEVKIPLIIIALQRSVHAVLLGKTLLPEWQTYGIKEKARSSQIHVPQLGTDTKGSTAIASDGKYLYIHNRCGLHKVGSGYGGTIQGHVYLSNPDFYPKIPGWLAFSKEQLFFKCIGDGSPYVTHVCREKLTEGKSQKIGGEGYGPNVMFSDGDYLGHVAATKDDSFVVRTFNPLVNPMPLVSELPLKLARKCMDTFGTSTWDPQVDMHSIEMGSEDDVVYIAAGKEFALARLTNGKVVYCGKAAALGIKQAVPAGVGKWSELAITKSPKVTSFSVGHDGQHALLVAEDGAVFFVGTPKRGEDGDASISKARRQPKAVKPKKMIKMEGKAVVQTACNAGSSAMVTRQGQLYIYGKDTIHCDHSGLVAELKDLNITHVALGKAHAVVLTNKGQVFTFGINNKGQCGREYLAGITREMSTAVTMVDEDEDADGDSSGLCAPGKHVWTHDKCMVCTSCGECTGYGSNCISMGRPDRNAGMLCGCGAGDSGCSVCGVCRACAGELPAAAAGDLGKVAAGDARPPPAEESVFQLLAKARNDAAAPGPLDMFIGRQGARNLDHLSRRLMEKKQQKARQKSSKARVKASVAEAASGSDYEQDHVKMASLPPGKVELPGAVTQIACGLQHTVLLLDSGEVYTFGSNQYGQLGQGDTNIRGAPVRLPVKAPVTQVAAGGNHTVLLTASGQVYTTGNYQKGQLGRPVPSEDNLKTKKGLWHAVPGLVPGIGAKHGRRATWIGASGDQTFLRIDESLINAHTLSRSNIIANQKCIGLIPLTDSGSAIKSLFISRVDGSCKSFSGAEQAGLFHQSVCLDPVYDVLWSYAGSKQSVACYTVTLSEARSLQSVSAAYPSVLGAELMVPVRHDTICSRSHSALHMLGCLDTLILAQEIGMTVFEEEKEKQTTSKVYTKEDFSAVNRFESHGGGWGYSGHSIEAIRFMADTDILLGGFGLFGGRGEYFGKIKVFELGPDGSDNEPDGDVIAETEEIPYECGAREKFAMLFDEPVALSANHWYVAWARISGPSSDCGSSGQTNVTTDEQIVFKFKSSKKSNNGTDLNAGQIPQLLFRLPSQDLRETVRHSEMAEPAHILTHGFSSTVTTECFEALLKLLNWSWNTFCAAVVEVQGLKGASFTASLLDLERLVYISSASLRLTAAYVNQVFPKQGKQKLHTESTKMAQCIGDTRALLRKILAQNKCHIVTNHNEDVEQSLMFERLADRVLNQCHQTFTSCFHAFYPTNNLKWLCLCELLVQIEPSQNNIEGHSRLLAAVMEALCKPIVKLSAIMPINCEHETEQLLKKQYSNDDNTNSAAQCADIAKFPILVAHMTHRTEMEVPGIGHWSFKEILDKLLYIVILPVKQQLNKEAALYPDGLVTNTCALLAAVISELATSATGTETELAATARPLIHTPNRFTRTSPSAYWNTGNGSPDAICFTVDRPGIVIAGASIYCGGGVSGTYEYELELLDYSEGGIEGSGRWENVLETSKGSVSADDCTNDISEIKFEKPVPIKEGVKYAIRVKNRGPRTLNGDGGVNTVKCPDGTTFTFSSCTLSTNGTNNARGQLPQILYYSAPQDGENHVQNSKALAEFQARKNAIAVASAIFRAATELLHAAHTKHCDLLNTVLGKARMFSKLLPLVIAYIGPVVVLDPRGSVQVLGLIQELLPSVASLNSELWRQQKVSTAMPSSSPTDTASLLEGNTTSRHYAVVESDHPYKPATVANYKVTFPGSVSWMALEFDPSCGTAQAEDTLQLYIPARRPREDTSWTSLPEASSPEADSAAAAPWWPVLTKFSGATNWPSMVVILPGNEVCFSLETASDYVKDEKAPQFGFKCVVMGYEWGTHIEDGLTLLEKEIAYLGGMCASSLIRKDIVLPPMSVEEIDEDYETLEDGTAAVFQAHSALLSKGFALSQSPTISQALEGNLPFCWSSIERTFLKDFVNCMPGTSGGRLAAWLQPESYLDPKQCDIVYNKDELRCSWPTTIVVQTKDQYGKLVNVPDLKVEAKAVPVIKDTMERKKRMSHSDRDTAAMFGGHPPPSLDTPYQVTCKEKKDAYHAICMMRAYENYSFEELRFAAPSIRKPIENMLVRHNNDGTYSCTWTPGSTGRYNISVTLDDTQNAGMFKVEVKEPPHGVAPPAHPDKAQRVGNAPNRMRKFVAGWSAGLRIRLSPSLQSEQVGIIKPNGIIEFVDEIHNDDGVWLRLAAESISKWCSAGGGGTVEAWALQYNQHLGKTLLVPVEEPKSLLDELIRDTVLRSRLPDAPPGAHGATAAARDSRRKVFKGGPGMYTVVKCGASGHNVRCRPDMRATAIGMMVLGNTVMVTDDIETSEGVWVCLDKESSAHYCHDQEGESWSLAKGHDGVVYLQHVMDENQDGGYGADADPGAADSFGATAAAPKGFDFTTAQQTPTFSGFVTQDQVPTFSKPPGDPAAVVTSPTFGEQPQASTPLVGPAWPTFEPPAAQPKPATVPPPAPQRKDSLAAPDFVITKDISRDIPPELQGVSVRDLVKALGESRVNGNGVTPPRTPPGTPKKVISRSSSPRPASPGGGGYTTHPVPGPPRAPGLAAGLASPLSSPASRSPAGTPPRTPPLPHRGMAESPVLLRRRLSEGTPPRHTAPLPAGPAGRLQTGSKSSVRSASSSPHRGGGSGGAPVSLRAASVSPVRPALPDAVKGHFSIGASSPPGRRHDPDTRLSPKPSRKDRSKVLRTKRERAVSPVLRDRSTGTLRSRSGSLQKAKEPVKEAMSPTVAQALRTVFAAFMWHEGIVHDAMACASYLKFHPDLPKISPKSKSNENSLAGTSMKNSPASTPGNSLKKQMKRGSDNLPAAELLYSNINEALNRANESNENKSLAFKHSKPDATSELIRKERTQSESEKDEKSLEWEKQRTYSDTSEEKDGEFDPEQYNNFDDDLPPTMHHLVAFWEEISGTTHKAIMQNLILPSPSQTIKVRSRAEKKDKDKYDKVDKKSKKKKEIKYANAGQARGNLFGEAAGMFSGGDRETLCELCGGMFSHPVTYHMKQIHPGCGKHAGGQGYNSGGNFCGGWAGNCGDGGVGGSTWYLMCERCRDKYMRERRQASREKSKKSKSKKLTPSKQAAYASQPLEPHIVMKNNAMFLLDLASSAGVSFPNNKMASSLAGDSMSGSGQQSKAETSRLQSVNEDVLPADQSPFSPVPFLFLCQKGAQASDSAFADELIFNEEEKPSKSKEKKNKAGGKQRYSSLVIDANSSFEGSVSPGGGSRSLEASPIDSEPPAAKMLFQRSISEITNGIEVVEEEEDSNRLLNRKRYNSGDVGASLLCHPSAAMSRLLAAAAAGGGDRTVLRRPVMAFVIQKHDLDSLQLAMKQGLRKAACRVYALQAFNWLLRSVSQPGALHDLLWYFVNSLTGTPGGGNGTAAGEDEESAGDNAGGGAERRREAEERECMCEHPLSDLTPGLAAGEASSPPTTPPPPLRLTLHTFLQSVADVMMHLPHGSALQQMAVRCWCISFQPQDHQFLHKSHVFSNISKILSKSDEGWGLSPEVGVGGEMGESTVTAMRDLTPQAELKASSRQAMIASLTDNSTETFWESGDEDRNKTKVIQVLCAAAHRPGLVYVHIDNARDLGNKVSSVVFLAGGGAGVGGLDDSVAAAATRLQQTDVEARHSGWVHCHVPPSASRSLRLELKGPDNSLRIRQVKVLGEVDNASNAHGKPRTYVEMQQQNCEAETLKVFRLLTSQVFGKLICDDKSQESPVPARPAEADMDSSTEVHMDLKEHMVGILFSRSKLTHLQKQVCSHIVQAIRKETLRVRDVWESNLSPAAGSAGAASAGDAYCFELLSMVLALSGSAVGSKYLAQQHSLVQDLLSLLHTASPRVQRQVASLLRRVLPEVSPQSLASLTDVSALPPADFSIITTGKATSLDIHRVGILDVFLACIAKSLTVQTKTKVKREGGSKGTSSFKIGDCLTDSAAVGPRWWLRGSMSPKLARTLIGLLRDLAGGKLSAEWAAVTKAAVAESILALTRLPDELRNPAACINTPTLWLALASLCVLDQDHVERLSSGQWAAATATAATAGDPTNTAAAAVAAQRPTCENHDDGETPAIIHCTECGDLCAECDRFLHLHRRTHSHHRQVFKEEEEAIKVDLHEGCGRTKLFWVMALTDSKTLKSLVEFRDGTKKLGAGGGAGGGGACRFCGSGAITSLTAAGNVCADAECQKHADAACTKTLACGHRCYGIRDEDPACLPCLHGCGGGGVGKVTTQDADDMCMICFTEALAAAPTIQIACGHMFHLHCCKNVLEKRWVGPRITFSFSTCPICKCEMTHPVLYDDQKPIRALYEDVQRKALMRLEYEGLHKAEAITTPGARFYNDPSGFAMERYAYYVCFKCSKAYYGGEARCEDQAGAGADNYDPSELVCGACSDVSRAQMCPKHGTDFLEYKCRYCCSVAVFFCFGTTHFCNACHDDFQRVTNIAKHDLPKCPAGPKAMQLKGEECPLHVQHPPTGEEFALGCGVCRNAHTF